jgi:hypothetical protein
MGVPVGRLEARTRFGITVLILQGVKYRFLTVAAQNEATYRAGPWRYAGLVIPSTALITTAAIPTGMAIFHPMFIN